MRRGAQGRVAGRCDDAAVDDVHLRPWARDDEAAVASLLGSDASPVWTAQGHALHGPAQLTTDTSCPVFFCDPRSPWQRGTNENTNRLVRQYLSKNADLRVHDQAALDAIAARLNGRPRRILGWRTPAEAYAEL